MLAQNQGAYNLLLAAGIVWGLLSGAELLPRVTFFLACVAIVGVVGAVTSSKRILFVQTAPAVAAIVAQGMASGEIREDLPAEILAEYLLGMLRTRSWELEGWPEAQRSLAAVVDLFINGAGRRALLQSQTISEQHEHC